MGATEALSEPSVARQWNVVAASVRGAVHERTGQPCQDSYFYRQQSGVLIAAVADGAGSAEFAEIGSALAACAAVEALATEEPLPETAEAWQAALLNAVRTAQATLESEASARQIPVRELATTLILSVATSDGVAVLQIGDGAAVIADRAGNLEALTIPQCGEYLNETTFLISPDALDTAQFSYRQGEVTHLALFSDGLQMVALQMPGGEPYAPFFTPLFAFSTNITEVAEAEAELTVFLSAPRLSARTDDDRTLLLASQKVEGVGGRV